MTNRRTDPPEWYAKAFWYAVAAVVLYRLAEIAYNVIKDWNN